MAARRHWRKTSLRGDASIDGSAVPPPSRRLLVAPGLGVRPEGIALSDIGTRCCRAPRRWTTPAPADGLPASHDKFRDDPPTQIERAPRVGSRSAVGEQGTSQDMREKLDRHAPGPHTRDRLLPGRSRESLESAPTYRPPDGGDGQQPVPRAGRCESRAAGRRRHANQAFPGSRRCVGATSGLKKPEQGST